MSHGDVAAARAASRQLVREFGFLASSSKAHGVTFAQCHALIELERHGQLTVRDLVELLNVDKSTASRAAAALVDLGLARPVDGAHDRRTRPLQLQARGRQKLARIHGDADARVEKALGLLSGAERATAVAGLALFAKALRLGRQASAFRIRPIRRADERQVAAIIRKVMTEHGASGAGFAIHDPEVDAMAAAYRGKQAAYFVVADADGAIMGGGGIAPLSGGDAATCELRKMYFLPGIRGLGLGARLLERCLDAAAERGFRTCYLETLDSMDRARKLYEAFGFRRLCGPEGSTGHFACDAYYALDLKARGRRSAS